MERKLCAECGSANLESEALCWACGARRFAPPGVHLAGEPTLSLGQALEPTLSWVAVDRRPPMTLLYAAAGVAAALFAGSVGFWIGRASDPGPVPAPQTAAPAPPASTPFAGPRALPPPVVASLGPTSFTVPPDPPIVTVRTKALPARTAYPSLGQFGDAARAAVSTTPPFRLQAGPVPSTVVYRMPRRTSAPAVVQRSPVVSPAAPAPAPPMTIPAPARNTAVVALRNDAATSVELTLEGPDSRTVVIAPGSTVPFSLSPGTYALRASGAGAGSALSSLLLVGGHTYALTLVRRPEGSRDALAIIEPALDQ